MIQHIELGTPCPAAAFNPLHRWTRQFTDQLQRFLTHGTTGTKDLYFTFRRHGLAPLIWCSGEGRVDRDQTHAKPWRVLTSQEMEI